jgi:hypothetical protein
MVVSVLLWVMPRGILRFYEEGTRVVAAHPLEPSTAPENLGPEHFFKKRKSAPAPNFESGVMQLRSPPLYKQRPQPDHSAEKIGVGVKFQTAEN